MSYFLLKKRLKSSTFLTIHIDFWLKEIPEYNLVGPKSLKRISRYYKIINFTIYIFVYHPSIEFVISPLLDLLHFDFYTSKIFILV